MVGLENLSKSGGGYSGFETRCTDSVWLGSGISGLHRYMYIQMLSYEPVRFISGCIDTVFFHLASVILPRKVAETFPDGWWRYVCFFRGFHVLSIISYEKMR